MMGSTLEFRTGFEHGRRKKALAGGISRSPAAKRVAIICKKIRRPKKNIERERRGREGARNGDGLTKGEGIYVDSTGKGTRLTILAGSNSSEGIGFEGMATISLFR
jgi:hypothetical protein